MLHDRQTLGEPNWAAGPGQRGVRGGDGARRWTDDLGRLHRDGAAAVVHADGREEFWAHGRRVDAAGSGA
jgi:hypothetical protein